MKNQILVIAILTIIGLGCKMPGFLQRGNTNSASNVATGTTTANDPSSAPTDNPREDVIRTSKKFLELDKFSATMDGEGKMPMHIELDYQAPDRFHMKYDSTAPGVPSETVIIGKDMYMKQGDTWQKLPGALGKTVPQIRQFFDEKGLAALTNVKYVGEESVDGENTYLYSYRNTGTKEVPLPFTSKVWVRAKDGLPQKIEVEYEGGDLKTMSIAYDYDKPVSVEPPK